MELHNLTQKSLAEAMPIELAVLPWGSTEPHGMHLPIGTDAMLIERMAQAGCRKAEELGAKVLLLPTVPFGTNSNMLAFPMALNISPTTQLAMLKDITGSLDAYKVPKLLLFNGHGGNEFRALLREIYGFTEVKIFLLEVVTLLDEAINEICNSRGDHACEFETSLMMYMRPELVHMHLAGNGETATPRLRSMTENLIWTVKPWHLYTTDSTAGNPRNATPAKGRLLFEKGVARLAKLMVELAASVVDDKFPY